MLCRINIGHEGLQNLIGIGQQPHAVAARGRVARLALHETRQLAEADILHRRRFWRQETVGKFIVEGLQLRPARRPQPPQLRLTDQQIGRYAHKWEGKQKREPGQRRTARTAGVNHPQGNAQREQKVRAQKNVRPTHMF